MRPVPESIEVSRQLAGRGETGLDVATAYERLLGAAERAGVPAHDVAEAVIETQAE